MQPKIAILTTIFPEAEAFFDDFFFSLINQTNSNFEVITVNDGVKLFDVKKTKYSELNIIEIESSTSPAKNREVGIKWVQRQGYTYLIFADIDDYFSENRVEISISLLGKHQIIINDLSIFSNKKLYCEKYISNRIADKSNISLDFIRDKNIFGLSNTAVRVSAIPNFYFLQNLVAVDWYFFTLLLLNGATAIFTNQCVTYYRQHEGSTVGMGEISATSIQNALSVKKKHYQALSKITKGFGKELEEMKNLESRLDKTTNLEKLIEQDLPNPLWWEEANNI